MTLNTTRTPQLIAKEPFANTMVTARISRSGDPFGNHVLRVNNELVAAGLRILKFYLPKRKLRSFMKLRFRIPSVGVIFRGRAKIGRLACAECVEKLSKMKNE